MKSITMEELRFIYTLLDDYHSLLTSEGQDITDIEEGVELIGSIMDYGEEVDIEDSTV